MRPNIFEIATKELSQDAFITWLLRFADDDFEKSDYLLNQCGKDFIKELIKKQFSEFHNQIKKVNAGRQWKNIDIWAEVDDRYLIVIEDKIHSSHHSNQLNRYKSIAENWCIQHNYLPPICIYLKTGNESQSRLNEIQRNGFSIFMRTDIINVLGKYSTCKNNIFIDFYERLLAIEKSNNQFESKIIGEWNGDDWQGFFQFLEGHIDLINWHYVNNAKGGFWSAILNWYQWDIYPTYIQLEEGTLCFKVSTDPRDVDMPDNFNRAELRNSLHELIIQKSTEFGLDNIKRPNRFGNGKYMTVAIVDRLDWLGQSDKTVDKEDVIKQLKTYMKFLEKIL